MDKRVANFEALKTHPWLSRIYARLRGEDVAYARDFLGRHTALAKGDFESAVNRMFMDNPAKPKRWKEIQELLLCANSAL